MADKIIAIPGVGNVAFPDTMSDEDIAAQIRKQGGGSDKSVGRFAKNAVNSAGQFAKDVAAPVLHPQQTVEGLTQLFQGMAEKSGFKPANGVSHEQNVDALFTHYKDRYGSIEGFKNALYTDPVGVMADIATLAGGVGATAKGAQFAAKAATLPKVAAAAGEVARGAEAVSAVTDPLRIATKAGGAVLDAMGRPLDAVSDALTRGALRGGTENIGNTKDPAKVTAIAEDNARAVRAMNDANLPFSAAGLHDLGMQIIDLRKRQRGLTGGAHLKIDPAAVEKWLDDALNSREWQVNPNLDVKQIEQVRQNFRERTGGAPILDAKGRPTGKFDQGPPMPAAEAQALKEGTYKNNKYGSEAPPHLVATAEAEKALAHGLMVQLERAIPELGSINEELGQQLGLQKVLTRALTKHTESGGFWGNLARGTVATKEGAMKLGGIAAAGAYSGQPIAAAGLAITQAVLSDPAVKQRLAIAINKAQQLNPSKWGTPSMKSAFEKVESLATGLSRVDQEQQ